MRMVYEKIVSGDDTSFHCREWNDADFDCPHHFHPELEITLILASRGERLVGDAFDTFAPGDLAMFGPNLPHAYRNEKTGRAHSLVVQFLPDALGEGFFDLPGLDAVRQLLRDASRGLTFSEPTRRAGRRIMTRLFNAESPVRRVSLLLELLDVLSADAERKEMASHDFMVPDTVEQGRRLERILHTLDTRWREPISLADVAEAVGLHPQSLSRYFRRHVGMTCQQYLMELRLSRAARAVLDTDRQISDIAFDCGFNNLAHFNRQFLARYHASPRDYRAAAG